MKYHKEVHAQAMVIDGHADTALRFAEESWDFTDPLGEGMLNLESAKRGNLTAEFFAIWVDPVEWPGRFALRAMQLIDCVHEQVRRHPERLALCCTADEIVSAHENGRFGVLMGLEGGHAIEKDLALLREYYRLGIRYMTLTWSHSVGWADSSGDVDDDSVVHVNGLSAFGREVVQEMNRLGMMVDVSHVSDKTFWDVADISSAPILASHSSARALTQAPRNLSDEQLRAVRDSGGIVMLNFFAAFVDERWRQAWNGQRAERRVMQEKAAAPFRERSEPVPFRVSNAVDRIFATRIKRPPLESLIDHFAHIIDVAGIDHVGIGSDFDGIPAAPSGLDSAADLPRITEALMARGIGPNEMHRLLGGNLLRVLRATEQEARRLRFCETS